MAKFIVYMQTVLSGSVTVEVPDDETDEEILQELAIEQAYDVLPVDLCAQCSGWGRKYGLDLAEWEVSEGTPEYPSVYRVEE